MESTLPEFDRYGVVRERTGTNLTGIVPSNTYPTADGRHIVIGGNGDSIYKRLMNAIGRADLADDPALANNAGRALRVTEIDEAIAAWSRGLTLDEALAVMEQADVPSGRIYSIEDIVRDPQYQARGVIEQATLDDGSTLSIPRWCRGCRPRLVEQNGWARRSASILKKYSKISVTTAQPSSVCEIRASFSDARGNAALMRWRISRREGFAS